MIVVDRIEGNRAVIEVDGEMFDIPSSALPKGTEEGALLQLSAHPDAAQELSKVNEERLSRLRDGDPGDMEIDI